MRIRSEILLGCYENLAYFLVRSLVILFLRVLAWVAKVVAVDGVAVAVMLDVKV